MTKIRIFIGAILQKLYKIWEIKAIGRVIYEKFHDYKH